jgi:AraC-like DNA-binding protein
MRLNSAAMKIATGTNVSEAAMAVGYVSSSQFSREFKRLYGQVLKSMSPSVRIGSPLILSGQFDYG